MLFYLSSSGLHRVIIAFQAGNVKQDFDVSEAFEVNLARRLRVINLIKRRATLYNASVNSSSAHLFPPPPPRADPRELAFFENELANAPPPGQKSFSNVPG